MFSRLIAARQVKYLGGYRLRLTFSDGAVKDVDLADELWGPMFEPLKDAGLFAQVRVDPELGTIVLPNGVDVAPERLYSMGETVSTEPA